MVWIDYETLDLVSGEGGAVRLRFWIELLRLPD